MSDLVKDLRDFSLDGSGSARVDNALMDAADRIEKLEAAITSAIGDLSEFGEAFTNAAVECARRSLREALGRTE